MTSSGHAHLDSRRFRQPASDVAENLKEVSCTKRTGLGNDFELIPTVKVETRLPVEGSSGNKFPSIYNHCGVVAAWSRKTLKTIKFLSFFLVKRPLTGKFSKFCSKRIHRDTDRRVVFKFREIWLTEIGKIVHTVSARKWIQYSAQASSRVMTTNSRFIIKFVYLFISLLCGYFRVGKHAHDVDFTTAADSVRCNYNSTDVITGHLWRHSAREWRHQLWKQWANWTGATSAGDGEFSAGERCVSVTERRRWTEG